MYDTLGCQRRSFDARTSRAIRRRSLGAIVFRGDLEEAEEIVVPTVIAVV
jgi:hypothetical protein